MVKDTSQMFITGPPVIKEVTGEEVTMERLGGWKVHAEKSGVADVVCPSDADCLDQIRTLLGFLPSNCGEPPSRVSPDDDPDRMLDGLDAIVPREQKKLYDIRKVHSASRGRRQVL